MPKVLLVAKMGKNRSLVGFGRRAMCPATRLPSTRGLGSGKNQEKPLGKRFSEIGDYLARGTVSESAAYASMCGPLYTHKCFLRLISAAVHGSNKLKPCGVNSKFL
ncbi:hypothetical protein KL921_002267 [Ogataea angusta]|uniref:Uncharacterized protein n=1 Tax=Pichia angusta TaxID=870730 RepID=A0ABQ7RPU7_PICAN|nr:hypothetical protein KL921_002267 [Ogataea angusta]KAG7835496.1 hypothetical protein KL942_005190 [Ogataea angusta]KAG7845594.1 hypothetical protein KL940_005150 [Ogataea angusta]KAG7849083.1 hypothetical protein KL941_001901 [Ogataea angusta]